MMFEDEELLRTRILDRTASDEDWVSFEEIARRDATAWDRLHQELRLDLALRRTLEPALSLADMVELPRIPTVPPLSRFLAPVGWLAALVLALLWVGTSDLLRSSSEPVPVQQQTKDGIAISDAGRRKDRGSLLEELPPDVLEMSPLEDGRVEMVYLRQTVERAVVDRVYRWTVDELGNPRASPVKASRFGPPRVF